MERCVIDEVRTEDQAHSGGRPDAIKNIGALEPGKTYVVGLREREFTEVAVDRLRAAMREHNVRAIVVVARDVDSAVRVIEPEVPRPIRDMMTRCTRSRWRGRRRADSTRCCA